MRLCEGAAQIDSVEKVARAFKLRACDILDPDLLKRMAAGEPLRMAEPRPPVMPEEDWRALPPRARALVEDLCAKVLAGQVSEADVSWLHDSLQRIARPAAPPPPGLPTTPMPPPHALAQTTAKALSQPLTVETRQMHKNTATKE